MYRVPVAGMLGIMDKQEKYTEEIMQIKSIEKVLYYGKLASILSSNSIASVTVVRMEVPCCGGLENALRRAIAASGKDIPFSVVTISTRGEILK